MLDNDLECLITGDEICNYSSNPEIAIQSSEYRAVDEPNFKKTRQSHSC